MNTPLEVALNIGRLVLEARNGRNSLDVAGCADMLLSPVPHSGFSRIDLVETLAEEANAAGVVVH